MQVAPGAKLAVPLRVDLSAASTTTLAALQGALTWSAGRLTFDSLRVVSSTGFSLTANTASAGTGSVSFNAFGTTALAASGPLAMAYFTAGSATGGTLLTLAPTIAGSEAGADILALLRVRNLGVCVAPTGAWGDANDDSAVNVIDAQQFARYSVGLSVANSTAMIARGDVTADGAVNVIDAQQIARYSVALSAAARVNTALYTPPAVASIALTPSGAQSLARGATTVLTSEPRDITNTSLAGCQPIAWTSSNSTVASVSNVGLVTALTVGSATITATGGGTSAATTVTIPNIIGFGFGNEQFASISAGTYLRGSASGEVDEQPVRSISISAFRMQKTEVTQVQWRQVMSGTALVNPSAFSTCGDSCPVESVIFDDVALFLSRLNAQDPGKGYRLPTEAEWEYAARAGTTGDFNVDGQAVEALGWIPTNALSKTWPVAMLRMNAWGLYDMHGNVWEWVSDWYDPTYYAGSAATDPIGPAPGPYRVLRGGAWDSGANMARSANRHPLTPTLRYSVIGFRLARNP